MIVLDLVNAVKENYSMPVPNYNEIISAFNRVIGEVNLQAQQTKKIDDIFATTEDEWEDQLTDAWEDLDSEVWEGLTNIADGYEYDSTNFILTLPRNITMVTRVYVDGKTYQNKDKEYMTKYPSDYAFNAVGNKIYFGEDVSSCDVCLIVKKLFDKIELSDSEYTDMPEDASSMLISGAIWMLSMRPKYRDEVLLSLNKDAYFNLRDGFSYNIVRFTPIKTSSRQHDF